MYIYTYNIHTCIFRYSFRVCFAFQFKTWVFCSQGPVRALCYICRVYRFVCKFMYIYIHKSYLILSDSFYFHTSQCFVLSHAQFTCIEKKGHLTILTHTHTHAIYKHTQDAPVQGQKKRVLVHQSILETHTQKQISTSYGYNGHTFYIIFLIKHISVGFPSERVLYIYIYQIKRNIDREQSVGESNKRV